MSNWTSRSYFTVSDRSAQRIRAKSRLIIIMVIVIRCWCRLFSCLSFAVSWHLLRSGVEMTPQRLYWPSPIERDTSRTPSTLPSLQHKQLNISWTCFYNLLITVFKWKHQKFPSSHVLNVNFCCFFVLVNSELNIFGFELIGHLKTSFGIFGFGFLDFDLLVALIRWYRKSYPLRSCSGVFMVLIFLPVFWFGFRSCKKSFWHLKIIFLSSLVTVITLY